MYPGMSWTKRCNRCDLRNIFTYSCLAYNSLSKFVEITKEFLESNTVFGDKSVDALFNVIILLECWTSLEIAGVTGSTGAHGPHNVTEGCGSCHFILFILKYEYLKPTLT